MNLLILIILCVGMKSQMIENLNKLTKEVPFFMHLYSFLCAIRIITAGASDDYNINPLKTSFKT
jgi:hypothetical protein